MSKVIGSVSRVIGPVVEAVGVERAQMMELVQVGDLHLVGEIVRLSVDRATIQVYEDTTGLKPGSPVFGTGTPLSVELAPGLIGKIFDGIQRPLEVIRDQSNQYIQRGIHIPALDRNAKWHFIPGAEKGSELDSGALLGAVQESRLLEVRILVPPGMSGKLVKIAPEGDYRIFISNYEIAHYPVTRDS